MAYLGQESRSYNSVMTHDMLRIRMQLVGPVTPGLQDPVQGDGISGKLCSSCSYRSFRLFRNASAVGEHVT